MNNKTLSPHSEVDANTNATLVFKAQERPDLFQFLDYREYMKAAYSFEKQIDRDFSYAVWAERSGLKSRNFLRLIMLAKRNLTTDSTPLAIKALKLNRTEAQYFSNLVQYNQARQLESREHFLKQVLKQYAQGKVKTVRDSYRMFSSHYVPRIQALLAYQGQTWTAHALAQALNIKESSVVEALEHLQSLGLARETAHGWASDSANTDIPDDFGNLALQSFHKKCLEEAIAAINLPPATRTFGSIIVALTPQEYAGLKAKLDAALSAWMLENNSKDLSGKRLYQLNTNLIPVSPELIRSEESAPSSAAKPLSPESSKG